MIAGKTVLGLVQARGGSKGVPHKNIRPVGGKPLLAWTIEAAKKSKFIDHVILSSDDAEIIEVAKSLGCAAPFVRPSQLAQDDTPSIDSVLHALSMVPDYDFLVLLQPTSPLRSAEDIDNCIEYCVSNSANACVSVAESLQSPYWMYKIVQDGAIERLMPHADSYIRRQDLPVTYVLNGALYVANCAWLRNHKTFLTKETRAYVMPQERSIDIDSEMDFQILDTILRKKN
jgi:CMP-N,N'-diacetyllegionaminic acid synthase